jgi:hypothetical protein
MHSRAGNISFLRIEIKVNIFAIIINTYILYIIFIAPRSVKPRNCVILFSLFLVCQYFVFHVDSRCSVLDFSSTQGFLKNNNLFILKTMKIVCRLHGYLLSVS